MHRVSTFTPTYGLRDVLNGKHRINLHVTSLIAAFFWLVFCNHIFDGRCAAWFSFEERY